MLERVGIHREAMFSGIPIVAELSRNDIIEQLLAAGATARHYCPARRTHRIGTYRF
jgi:hypothetical protein